MWVKLRGLHLLLQGRYHKLFTCFGAVFFVCPDLCPQQKGAEPSWVCVVLWGAEAQFCWSFSNWPVLPSAWLLLYQVSEPLGCDEKLLAMLSLWETRDPISGCYSMVGLFFPKTARSCKKHILFLCSCDFNVIFRCFQECDSEYLSLNIGSKYLVIYIILSNVCMQRKN